MTRLEILKRLVEVESRLNADIVNPAIIDDAGYFKLYVHDEEALKEIVALIGEWHYKKRQEERRRLALERERLEGELLKAKL